MPGRTRDIPKMTFGVYSLVEAALQLRKAAPQPGLNRGDWSARSLRDILAGHSQAIGLDNNFTLFRL
jgi:hypothetical protein